MMRSRWIVGSSAMIMAVALATWLLPASLLGRMSAQEELGPVAITWPLAGSTVPGPNVLIQWEGPSPAGATPEAGMSVYLVVDSAAEVAEGQPLPDSPGVIRAGENPAIVPGLSPGEHVVQLVVTRDGAIPAEGFDRPVVSFTVRAPHPASLYRGTCDNLEANPAVPLEDIGSGLPGGTLVPRTEDGQATEPHPLGATTAFGVETSTSIVQTSLRDLLAQPYAIVVRASASDDTIIACGDIGGPVFRGTLRIGLAEVNASGYVGVATLTVSDDQTQVLIELTHNLFERSLVIPSTPVETATAVATSVPATPAETTSPQPTATATETPVQEATETPEPTATATVEQTAVGTPIA